jgi:predicted esterase
MPLLIYMHGAGGDYDEGTYFFSDSYVDSKGFIFATPSANDTAFGPHWWEMTAYFLFSKAQLHCDAVFLMDMLNKTSAEYNIDLSHIWLTGFSDGGTMSLRMGVSLSHVLSVSCPHSATWGPDNLANPGWAQRKIPFYARLGSGDSGRLPNNQAAQTAFQTAGHEYQFDNVPGYGHEWIPTSNDLFYNFEATRPLQHNWIRPAMSFNSPAPGEKWAAGSTHSIDWWLGCGNPSYDFTLELSTNGPSGPFTPVTTQAQPDYGTGSYSWDIPSLTPATTNAVLRATITDSSTPQKTNVSVMNYTFEITPGAVTETGMIALALGGGIFVMFAASWRNYRGDAGGTSDILALPLAQIENILMQDVFLFLKKR